MSNEQLHEIIADMLKDIGESFIHAGESIERLTNDETPRTPVPTHHPGHAPTAPPLAAAPPSAVGASPRRVVRSRGEWRNMLIGFPGRNNFTVREFAEHVGVDPTTTHTALRRLGDEVHAIPGVFRHSDRGKSPQVYKFVPGGDPDAVAGNPAVQAMAAVTSSRGEPVPGTGGSILNTISNKDVRDLLTEVIRVHGLDVTRDGNNHFRIATSNGNVQVPSTPSRDFREIVTSKLRKKGIDIR